MKWHFALIWDEVARLLPNEIAVICAAGERTWRKYENRSARLAAFLKSRELGVRSHVAMYGYNSAEWLETQYAAYKLRGSVINVNYRYQPSELKYLLDYADAEAVVFDARFGPKLAEIRDALPQVKVYIEVDDRSGVTSSFAEKYEAVIASAKPLEPEDYQPDDLHLIFTGGTTGLPKGVVYGAHEFTATLLLGGYATRGFRPPRDLEGLRAALIDVNHAKAAPKSIPACPLMHSTAMSMGAMTPHFMGGTVIVFRNEHFNADEFWGQVEKYRASEVTIVGDAFALPMLKALREADAAGKPYDISSLRRLHSSGVVFSREVKESLFEYADVVITDVIGASEGSMGMAIASRKEGLGDTSRFRLNPKAKVFAADDREIEPGSDKMGMIAASGLVPLRYHKDEEKSAATFREIDGVRYSFPGDFAKVAADGTLILLGRGSGCINTGGEKVFPEEVELALKTNSHVLDCIVVGAPDKRFGQCVVAVVATAAGVGDAQALHAYVKERLAGYKSPRHFVFVSEIIRLPNGKPDLAWAKERAEAAVVAQSGSTESRQG